MVTEPNILIKIFLASILIAALLPLVIYKHKSNFSYNIILLPIAACLVESICITYFYIYSGRAQWKALEIGVVSLKFYLEPLGIIFFNLLIILWLISALYSMYHMTKLESKNLARFLTFIGLTIFAAIFIALSKNLFTMFIGYEMLTLFTIPLVAHNTFDKREVLVYIKTLIGTSIGLLLPFVIYVYYVSGTTEFILDGIIPQNLNPLILHLLLFLAFFGTAKTAMLPFHNWITAAMIAPYPVSALLHAVAVVKAGIFCILKIVIYIFGLKNLAILLQDFNWPLLAACFTLVFASYQAVRTSMVKHVLAYSTIANLALMMIAVFVLTPQSLMAAIAHMIGHSFTKITLFFSTGIFYTMTKSNYLKDLRGIGYKSPVTSIFFIIAALSMIGVPPLIGSATKDMIWEAMEASTYSYVLKISLVLYIMSVIYFMGKLTYLIFAKDGVLKERMPISGMKIATAASAIGTVSFPILEKFMKSLLWAIL